jgi:hypothetical protein
MSTSNNATDVEKPAASETLVEFVFIGRAIARRYHNKQY